jgi:UDP-GlcNAc:undecaprenyl-phosphate GlcNAc-1-phosphate transferase
MSRLGAYVVVFAVVALVTGLCTPIVRHLAFRIGAVQKPDAERRVHKRPTPVLGGIAMLVGLLVGMLVAWRMGTFSEVFGGSTQPIGVVVAATIIVVIGAIDDLREVSAPAKMAGTVLAASVLVYSGVQIIVFRVPFQDVLVLSQDWAYLITVIWVIGMTTAINYIDGLDGLAAGIVAISAATFFLYTMRLTDVGVIGTSNLGPLLAVIVLGMCIGFLPWNVHPAKIFMGDTGALLLGLLMAASTIVVGGTETPSYSGSAFFFYAPLLIPLLILGVPILDTAWSIVRRASKGKGVATADKDHLHHRLVRLGHGYWRSVLILWAWTALLCGFVLYPTYTGAGNGIVPFGILGLLLLLYTLLHPSAMRARKLDAAEDQKRQLAGVGGSSRSSRRNRAGRTTATPPPGRSRRSRASSRSRSAGD